MKKKNILIIFIVMIVLLLVVLGYKELLLNKYKAQGVLINTNNIFVNNCISYAFASFSISSKVTVR